jgi:transcriptional regulator with XRE-family HTH domain
MRPSKAVHVLAKVRIELGETQKGFANMCRCHCRTIQQIELGKLRLSRTMAMRISERTGVSVEWLLANDKARGIVDVLDRKWSPDKESRKRWAGLRPRIRVYQLLICTKLFEEYLRLRSLIESLPNPGKAMREWESLHREAFLKFLENYEPVSVKFGLEPKNITLQDFDKFAVSVSSETLKTAQGDIYAILDFQSAKPPKNSRERAVDLFVGLGGGRSVSRFCGTR